MSRFRVPIRSIIIFAIVLFALCPSNCSASNKSILSSFFRSRSTSSEVLDQHHQRFYSLIDQIVSVLKELNDEDHAADLSENYLDLIKELNDEDHAADLSENYLDLIKELNFSSKNAADNHNNNNSSYLSFDPIVSSLNTLWNEIKYFNDNCNNNNLYLRKLNMDCFKDIISWAIEEISTNHKEMYWKLIQFAINENIYPELYVQILRKSYLMTHKDIHYTVDTLYSKFLGGRDQNQDYASFDFYFLELALYYPKFSSLSFISAKETPAGFEFNSRLDVIYSLTEFIEILQMTTCHLQSEQQQSINLDSEKGKLNQIIFQITRIILDSNLNVTILLDGLTIIFDSEQFKLLCLSPEDQVSMMSMLSDSIKYIAKTTRNLYPEVGTIPELALFIENNYKTLILKFLEVFKPQFTVCEYVYFLNLAEKKNPEDPDCLIILFEKVQTSKHLWLVFKQEQEYFFGTFDSSARLHIFIDIINSIHEQFPYTYLIKTSVRSEEYSNMLQWRIPNCMNNNLNYDHILSTADVFAIPILFISIVFNYDFRSSTILKKYKKNGKPLRNQLTHIINDIIEKEVRSIPHSYPKYIIKLVNEHYIPPLSLSA